MTLLPTPHSRLRSVLIAVFIVCLFGLAVYASLLLQENETILNIVENFGYLGVFTLATRTGLSFFSPIPAATFTPLYSAAGLYLPAVVIVLALGTLLADALGFLFGKTAHQTIASTYPNITRIATEISDRRWLSSAGVFFYAAFVPFPNEAMLIPLAAAGVTWRFILIPLLLGNLLHQLLIVGGISLLTI